MTRTQRLLAAIKDEIMRRSDSIDQAAEPLTMIVVTEISDASPIKVGVDLYEGTESTL